MEITRCDAEGCVRLTLVGRFDAAWSNHVQEALAECVRNGQHAIELDLSRVVFLSSAGIRVLLLTYRQLRAIDGRLAVVEASAEVRQVIELAGLRALLESAPAAAGERASADAGPRRCQPAGLACEVYTLAADARIAVRACGDPLALLSRGGLDGPLRRESFPPNRIAVGIGAFGNEDDAAARLGELLALGGAALTLPTSGEDTPDWVLAEEQLVPEARLAYGLIGEGDFAALARFEAGEERAAVPVDTLAAAALEITGAEAAAIAVIAEMAEFVGAALRRSPVGRSDIFAFPAVRDELDFTAEPAHAGTVGVIAGFVARRAPASMAPQLRPLDRDGALLGHLHAAVFPYRPIRRGRLELRDSVRELFQSQTVLDLLHLVHDWRPGSGAGQSSLRRGALWCAPVLAPDGGVPA